MIRKVFLLTLMLLSFGLAGCAPRILGVSDALPTKKQDQKEAWLYIYTDQYLERGLYRCYDNNKHPVCKKVQLESNK